MSLLAELRKNNIGLLRRVEMASAFAPLAEASLEVQKATARAAAKARSFEEIPEEYRRLIEESEAQKAHETLISTMLKAKSREQVIEARRLRDEYLRQNPDAYFVWEVSESLEIKAAILGLPEPEGI